MASKSNYNDDNYVDSQEEVDQLQFYEFLADTEKEKFLNGISSGYNDDEDEMKPLAERISESDAYYAMKSRRTGRKARVFNENGFAIPAARIPQRKWTEQQRVQWLKWDRIRKSMHSQKRPFFPPGFWKHMPICHPSDKQYMLACWHTGMDYTELIAAMMEPRTRTSICLELQRCGVEPNPGPNVYTHFDRGILRTTLFSDGTVNSIVHLSRPEFVFSVPLFPPGTAPRLTANNYDDFQASLHRLAIQVSIPENDLQNHLTALRSLLTRSGVELNPGPLMTSASATAFLKIHITCTKCFKPFPAGMSFHFVNDECKVVSAVTFKSLRALVASLTYTPSTLPSSSSEHCYCIHPAFRPDFSHMKVNSPNTLTKVIAAFMVYDSAVNPLVSDVSQYAAVDLDEPELDNGLLLAPPCQGQAPSATIVPLSMSSSTITGSSSIAAIPASSPDLSAPNPNPPSLIRLPSPSSLSRSVSPTSATCNEPEAKYMPQFIKLPTLCTNGKDLDDVPFNEAMPSQNYLPPFDSKGVPQSTIQVPANAQIDGDRVTNTGFDRSNRERDTLFRSVFPFLNRFPDVLLHTWISLDWATFKVEESYLSSNSDQRLFMNRQVGMLPGRLVYQRVTLTAIYSELPSLVNFILLALLHWVCIAFYNKSSVTPFEFLISYLLALDPNWLILFPLLSCASMIVPSSKEKFYFQWAIYIGFPSLLTVLPLSITIVYYFVFAYYNHTVVLHVLPVSVSSMLEGTINMSVINFESSLSHSGRTLSCLNIPANNFTQLQIGSAVVAMAKFLNQDFQMASARAVLRGASLSVLQSVSESLNFQFRSQIPPSSPRPIPGFGSSTRSYGNLAVVCFVCFLLAAYPVTHLFAWTQVTPSHDDTGLSSALGGMFQHLILNDLPNFVDSSGNLLRSTFLKSSQWGLNHGLIPPRIQMNENWNYDECMSHYEEGLLPLSSCQELTHLSKLNPIRLLNSLVGSALEMTWPKSFGALLAKVLSMLFLSCLISLSVFLCVTARTRFKPLGDSIDFVIQQISQLLRVIFQR